uniref:Uncharacterized protein n=1 Tax=Melopsittacus undulatus TaxID=13146 RepID=A0A8C6JQS2_MELUD
MAEDHGLSDGDAAIDVAESFVLLLPAPAHEEVLPDVAEGELVLPQHYHDGVGDDSLSELPHGCLEGGREQQHLAALGESPGEKEKELSALRVDHDVGFIQHEEGDLLQVHNLLLETPIQHRSWRPDDDLLLYRDKPLGSAPRQHFRAWANPPASAFPFPTLPAGISRWH